jgi:hypothetical protein
VACDPRQDPAIFIAVHSQFNNTVDGKEQDTLMGKKWMKAMGYFIAVEERTKFYHVMPSLP